MTSINTHRWTKMHGQLCINSTRHYCSWHCPENMEVTPRIAHNSHIPGFSASYQRIKSTSSAGVRTGVNSQGNPLSVFCVRLRYRAPNTADLRRSMSAAEAAVRLTLEGNPLLPVTSSHCSLQLRSWELWRAPHGVPLNSHTLIQTWKCSLCS